MLKLVDYYGGKVALAKWIEEQFAPHHTYVEVFGGGGGVLLNKKRSKVEVLNDFDNEIVNLYQVMRDHGDEIKRLCELTPYARAEYSNARQEAADPIERARRTIIKCHFGIGDSLARITGFHTSKQVNQSHAVTYSKWCEKIPEIVARFRGVVVENLDFQAVIEKYDHQDTLFYLDPPYVLETRTSAGAYKADFKSEDHSRLLSCIKNLQGMVVLSGYDHESYDVLGWKKVKSMARIQGNGVREECLWLCPKTAGAFTQVEFSFEK